MVFDELTLFAKCFAKIATLKFRTIAAFYSFYIRERALQRKRFFIIILFLLLFYFPLLTTFNVIYVQAIEKNILTVFLL